MSKRKKAKGLRTPLIRLVGLGAAVVAADLAGPVTNAAPGDLDPTFGDVGRQLVEGPLWSVDLQDDDDSLLFASGEHYCGYYYSCYFDEYIGILGPDGLPDADFAGAVHDDSAAYDAVPQPDGKVVATGSIRLPDGKVKMHVYRLRPDGSHDPDFGLNGTALVSDATDSYEAGYSVVVDTQGRIVIAGARGNSLQVVRLLPGGTLDPAFGTAGVLTQDAAISTYPSLMRITLGPNGGYRVMSNRETGSLASSYQCTVLAVTDVGVVDSSYGVGGTAVVQESGRPDVTCRSLTTAANGSSLVAGSRGPVAYAGRLLPSGAVDTSFTTGAAVLDFSSFNALAVNHDGAIYVAGRHRANRFTAHALKLLPGGATDTSFGSNGVATFDAPSARVSTTDVNDLAVTADDQLVLGGNVEGSGFVARLLDSGGGPGVLSVVESQVIGTEQGGQAVIHVRRSGGSTGDVAVSYTTREFTLPIAEESRAALNNDFTTATNRLTWEDGDTSEREIIVPILSDSLFEVPELFELVLESPEGGAGIGTSGGSVEIAGDGYPRGTFAVSAALGSAREGQQSEFWVYRNWYSEGEVSVTLHVVASSAGAGTDYQATPGTAGQDVVLTWADGDASPKEVTITGISDNVAEPVENVQFELISPTGGAVLSPNKQVTFSIVDVPPANPRGNGNGNGGGGSFGGLGALLLGLASAARRRVGKRY